MERRIRRETDRQTHTHGWRDIDKETKRQRFKERQRDRESNKATERNGQTAKKSYKEKGKLGAVVPYC